MLKQLPRSSPASSPRFHYAPASQSLPTSPSPRRNSKLTVESPLSKATVPHRVQYVDKGTQWSPVMHLEMDPPSTERVKLQAHSESKPQVISSLAAAAPSAALIQPILQPESPGMKRRQVSEVPSSVATNRNDLPTKRPRAAQSPTKILPSEYEFCPVEDMVVIIANMISELIHTNDQLPLRSVVLTRFHSRWGVDDLFTDEQSLQKYPELLPEYQSLIISRDLRSMRLLHLRYCCRWSTI